MPLEREFELIRPNDAGMATGRLCAFNTVITLQSYSAVELCREVFERADERCRLYEPVFAYASVCLSGYFCKKLAQGLGWFWQCSLQ